MTWNFLLAISPLAYGVGPSQPSPSARARGFAIVGIQRTPRDFKKQLMSFIDLPLSIFFGGPELFPRPYAHGSSDR